MKRGAQNLPRIFVFSKSLIQQQSPPQTFVFPRESLQGEVCEESAVRTSRISPFSEKLSKYPGQFRVPCPLPPRVPAGSFINALLESLALERGARSAGTLQLQNHLVNSPASQPYAGRYVSYNTFCTRCGKKLPGEQRQRKETTGEQHDATRSLYGRCFLSSHQGGDLSPHRLLLAPFFSFYLLCGDRHSSTSISFSSPPLLTGKKT